MADNEETEVEVTEESQTEQTQTEAPPSGISEEQAREIAAQAVATARAEWEAEQQSALTPTQVQKGTYTERYGEFLDEYGSIKPATQEEFFAKLQADAIAEAEARMDAKYGGTIRQREASHAVADIADGLGKQAREFLEKTVPRVEELNPTTREILRNAAENIDRKYKTERENVETTHGDPRPQHSAEDRQTYDLLLGIASRGSGVDPDKLKLKDSDIPVGLSLGDNQ